MGREDKRVVFVTGFGPFGRHVINSSWEAVKLLPKKNLEDEFNVRLVVDEIPVKYDVVQSHVCKKWQELQPHLVIHVGVSHVATEVTLEQRAHCSGYDQVDVEGCTPNGGICRRDVDESTVLSSGLDLPRVSRNVNAKGSPALVMLSNNAGRYLCEFIYFTSMCMDQSRTAFIHVPVIGHYSADDLAETIKLCIGEMLLQLDRNGSAGSFETTNSIVDGGGGGDVAL